MNEKLRRLLEKLKKEREELRLQVHLMKEEAKDEWTVVEVKLDNLELKLEHLKEGTRESAEDVGSAASLVAEEIREAYERIRNSLK
jgi:hypothetical protein